jgi:hypothetical protein
MDAANCPAGRQAEDHRLLSDGKELTKGPLLAPRERPDTSVALTSTLHWFETDVLAEERNYQRLLRLNANLIQ